ncbi:hypothetical protein AMATHDRAFT_2383 [Amanita thiersii Skay4041]|uniref:DNA-directed DNA polymerase n=1 Tax=Amanita thiersii Skay4041 TaxID=703135 RepID=A0A2A9NMC6_9AGAR|nr:hypothetical protein AMATHDRAFT_2383 [Amanita thiersii Skay4041]
MPSTKREPSPSSDDDEQGTKKRRFHSWEPHSAQDLIKVFILQTKLLPQAISDLYTLLETLNDNLDSCLYPKLELCTELPDADVIITAIRMRKRLERHIEWRLAREKAIVTPDWLRVSVKEGHPVDFKRFAAIKELRHTEAEAERDDPDATGPKPDFHPRSDLAITSDRVMANYASRYACTRASPLICPNQSLVTELAILQRHRELEGKDINALSYGRAIAVLKAFPRVITSEVQVKKLPHLGDKIQSKIREFIHKGSIQECRMITASDRYQALSAFTTIHGIGPTTARKLYEIGLRSLEDMERYYDVPAGIDSSQLASLEETVYTPNGKPVRRKSQMPELSVKVALALRKDLATTIPREEVEEMHETVMKQLNELQPGCVSTVVGGYRRGKPQSNDVDIVISHSDLHHGGNIIKGLGKKLTARLVERGLVTHVMHISGFHKPDALRQTHWDSLEKALTVFILPDDGKHKRIYRRLDLIFASPDAYWTAVIGWSGSKMFERDLRLWAKEEKGLKFDSTGLTRRHDSKVYTPKSEKEVFEILGLDWIDPTMRNADV